MQVAFVPIIWYNFVMGALILGRNEMLAILLKEFRALGFQGLSLSRIAEATGLGKASLYHHFPKGKDEMALQVMKFVKDWIQSEILIPINDKEIPPKKRLSHVLKTLDQFYEKGATACVIEMMLAGDVPPSVKGIVKECVEDLREGFISLGKDFGLSNDEAKKIAEQTLIGIQGSLIISRSLNDVGVFKRQIKIIENYF